MAPDVTNQDEMASGTRLSQSVTSTRQIELYLLQIETNRRHPNRKSKSVTPGPLLAAKMLQVETNGTITKVPVPFVAVLDKKEAAPLTEAASSKSIY
ncbi:MAG: hypothetical protein SPF97_05050 [Collinsella sp.]|nr:hypothetical protein [Collinsella sp.]